MNNESEPEKTSHPDGSEALVGGTSGSALIRYLFDHRSDWPALSRELRALADEQGGAESTAERDESQRAWLMLADYLAHGEPDRVPSEVRRLLDTPSGRAAEAAFTAALAHRDEWRELARAIARSQQS